MDFDIDENVLLVDVLNDKLIISTVNYGIMDDEKIGFIAYHHLDIEMW